MSATAAVTLHCDWCQVETITIDYVVTTDEARRHAQVRGWTDDGGTRDWCPCCPPTVRTDSAPT